MLCGRRCQFRSTSCLGSCATSGQAQSRRSWTGGAVELPVEIFDRTDGLHPRWPTFGVKVLPALPGADAELFPPLALPALRPVRELERVLATAIVGHDQSYIERPCVLMRTIDVDTTSVGIVEFGANEKKRDDVVKNGRMAAEQFVAGWDWDEYQVKCPGTAQQGDQTRRATVARGVARGFDLWAAARLCGQGGNRNGAGDPLYAERHTLGDQREVTGAVWAALVVSLAQIVVSV